MSQLTLTIDGTLMATINEYLSDKKYRLVKPFYDGISPSPTEGHSVMTQQSLKVLLNVLADEVTVQLYEKFYPLPGQLAAKEAAMKAASSAASLVANDSPEQDNIVPVSNPEIEEVKD